MPAGQFQLEKYESKGHRVWSKAPAHAMPRHATPRDTTLRPPWFNAFFSFFFSLSFIVYTPFILSSSHDRHTATTGDTG